MGNMELLGTQKEKIIKAFAPMNLDPEAPLSNADALAMKEAVIEFIDVTLSHAHGVRVSADACMDVAKSTGYPFAAMSDPVGGAYSNRQQGAAPAPARGAAAPSASASRSSAAGSSSGRQPAPQQP